MKKDKVLLLNIKQSRFCEEYLVDLNACRAYMKVYKPKNANTAAAAAGRMLTKVNVQKYIRARQEELQKKVQITQERVLQEYARIAFFDPRLLFNAKGNMKKLTDLDEDTARAVASVQVDEIGMGEVVVGQTKKIRMWDKVKALGDIGRHLGMFKDESDKPLAVNAGLSDDQFRTLLLEARTNAAKTDQGK